MNLEEIEAVLEQALPLRSPTLSPDDSGRKKVEMLQDYMLQTATVCGGLYEAKHWLVAVTERLADEWKHLEGWEPFLKRTRARATKEEIDAAKVKASPALYAAGRRARHLRASVIDQITRLEREGDRMSRAYTMLSGS